MTMDSSFHSCSSCGRLDIMSMPDRERERAGATTIFGTVVPARGVLAFKPKEAVRSGYQILSESLLLA